MAPHRNENIAQTIANSAWHFEASWNMLYFLKSSKSCQSDSKFPQVFPIFFFKALCRWSTGKVITPGGLTWIVFFICPVLVGNLWNISDFRRPGSSRGRGEKTEALSGWENDDGWWVMYGQLFFFLPFLGMIASKHSSWTREICSISLYMIYKSFRSTLNPHRIVEGMNYSAAIISSDSSWSFLTFLPPKVYQNRGRCWKWDREAIIGNMVSYLSDAKDRMMKAEDGLGSSVDRCSPLSFWGPAHFQGLC